MFSSLTDFLSNDFSDDGCSRSCILCSIECKYDPLGEGIEEASLSDRLQP